MKVFQINTFGNKSTGRIATDLYRTLKENGHEGKVAFARNSIAEDVPHIKIGNTFNVYLDGILTRITDKAGFYSKSATKKLIKEIKEYNPDIIHLHNLHGYYINVEILFKFLKDFDKPVVWTLHDCWAFTGHCCYYTMADCQKWQTGCSHCLQKNIYPTSLLRDNSKWNYEKKKELFTSLPKLRLVPVSDWLSEEVGKSFLKDIPRTVIKNGIDLSVFKPTESDFREKCDLKDKFIILGVASDWSPIKGLDDFVELSKQLDDSYKIVVVGVTAKQKKELPQNIISILRTESLKELAGLYSTADVLFNPTKDDNFPTVNIESLACGTPVISYGAGGSAEAFDETCGKEITHKDVLYTMEKLRDANFSKDMCVLRAEKYDSKTKYEEYIKLYENL